MNYFLILMLLIAQSVSAQEILKSGESDQKGLEVTVYNNNLGVVKDVRQINVSSGQGEIRFMDVAAQIMPETVHVKSLSNPDQLSILEQNYEYDLLNEQKLLDKYIGKDIKLMSVNEFQGKNETVDAVLLSNNNGQVYKINNEIYLGHPGYKILPSIPENLIAQPTLTWLYNNKKSGAQDVEVSYMTNGINWKADYVLVLDSMDTKADLSGWVTLDNKSGATYNQAKLKLIAGEVNRVSEPVQYKANYRAMEMMADVAGSAQFEEKAFFEYHIYDLQRPTTIKDNQTKQVSLLEANQAMVMKEYVLSGDNNYFFQPYRSDHYEKPVNVYIRFKNSKENNLGMPLPAGIIRLYKADTDKSLQFIGEDRIKHTPKDEEVKLKLGEAFDISAERKQTDYQLIGRNTHESTWEVTLRNHKTEDIAVNIVESVSQGFGDWEIVSSSHPYTKIDSQTVEFKIPVKIDQEVKVTYRVRVTYGY